MQSFRFVKLYIFLCPHIESTGILEIPLRKIKKGGK
jgi:hypothetical protein